MSSLKYSVYPGAGEFLSKVLYYKQAVRIGDRIEISGQGQLSRVFAIIGRSIF
jgi:hypothetical protein